MKNVLHYLMLLSLVAFIAVSCEEEIENDDAAELENTQELINSLDIADYFPMNVGDSLQIVDFPIRTFDTQETFNSIEYFRQRSDRSTDWYRKTAEGEIFKKGINENEYLRFNTAAEVNSSWTYRETTDGFLWHAKLISKTDTVIIGDYTFENCYRFYYDVEETADEEHTVWLAPGIGIIRIAGQLGPFNLECARIDTVKFCL